MQPKRCNTNNKDNIRNKNTVNKIKTITNSSCNTTIVHAAHHEPHYS